MLDREVALSVAVQFLAEADAADTHVIHAHERAIEAYDPDNLVKPE